MRSTLFSCLDTAPFQTLLAGGGTFAAGVSGGPDSIALIHSLSAHAQNSDFKTTFHALIIDHGLRPESAQEAAQVAAQLRDLPHVSAHILVWDGEKPANHIQEAARDARYDLMAAHCHAHGIDHLFLGHHGDDQAETVLFRLAGGSGLAGLGGMRDVSAHASGLILLRPFLSLAKADLIAYCTAHKLPFLNDPSNKNPVFARARMRASMDILAQEGLTAERLGVTARRLQNAKDALEHYAEQAFAKACTINETTSIDIDIKYLKNKPLEISFRVLIKCFKQLNSHNADLPRLHRVEDLCNAALHNQDFRARTLGGLYFKRNDKKLLLQITREKKS